MTGPRLRPITPADHADVLALNARDVHLLAPLDEERLVVMQSWADVAAVIDVGGSFGGFVLTFAAGSAYDGENFAWFAERHPDFRYLDRIVIHPDFRRRGLGLLAYDAIEDGPALLALEVNLVPPNEPSLAFHRARGYAEVGQRSYQDHTVTMMTKQLR